MRGDDFIDLFMEYTQGIPSPDIFRLWTGISVLAGALERRVWIQSGGGALYPNLYVLLVSRPGIGKTQAIRFCGELWRDMKEVKVSPSNLTKASLIDALAGATRKLVINNSHLVEYNSLQVAASELGVFVTSHDLEFLSVLNDIYDNPPIYDEARRSSNVKSVNIQNPQMTILAGTQPAYLAALLPEQAWGMGFTSRMVMVYSAERIRIDLFADRTVNSEAFTKLSSRLAKTKSLYGPAVIDDAAAAEMNRWYKEDCPPVPDHTKLESYITRRPMQWLKLCLIAAVARSGKAHITLADVNRARDWLLEAEQTMPDIFRDMSSRSDTHIIHELHQFMWQSWAKDKKPIHESRIINFLQARVPSEKVLKIIEIAERSNIIQLVAGTKSYSPVPKSSHGVE